MERRMFSQVRKMPYISFSFGIDTPTPAIVVRYSRTVVPVADAAANTKPRKQATMGVFLTIGANRTKIAAPRNATK